MAVVALSAQACSTPASPTIGTVSPQGLAGAWRLELLQPFGQGAVLTPAGATYTLTLAASGSVSTRVDCNTCGGTYAGARIYSSCARKNADSYECRYAI